MTFATPIKPHILVVDDEPEMCNICMRALQGRGYQVTAIHESTKAPDLIARQAYDLLLTDLKMPGVDGLQLAALARQRDPTAAIVMMTAYASYEHLHQAMQSGISDFVSKPFDLSQLVVAVTQALNRRSVIRDNVRLRTLEALRIDSEVLSSTLDYAALVHYVLNLAVRWSDWDVAALLIGDEKHRLASVTLSSAQWQLNVAGMAMAHQVLNDRVLMSLQSSGFDDVDKQATITTMIGVPVVSNTLQGVLLIGTTQVEPNIPSVSELMTLLANQSASALQNADLYGHIEGLYRRQRQIEAMKDEFIAIASHELRTPLTMVIGYTDLLKRAIPTGLVADQTNEIMQNALRMKEIIERMTNLQQIGLDEQLSLARIDIRELVDTVVMSVLERYSNVRIDVAVSATQASFVSDARWVRVVLVQLLMNAATHAKQPLIHLGVQTSDESSLPVQIETTSRRWLTLTVSDSGKGIPTQEQIHIFAPFTQVDHSLTRELGGTGLGLALVYDIVHQLKGYVWLSSHAEIGSVFVVMIPDMSGAD
jgi:signal transduction histidine kinase/CheY-like chemotaxis protein